MTEQRRTALKELQRLDTRIQEARERVRGFDPRFEEVEEPVLVLESELSTLRKRAQEMKLEERRLELSIDEKRERAKKLEDRLGSVRNLREEAAVSAELEMVRRALQNDEQEAYTLLDQIKKAEERTADVETALDEARALVEPKKEGLLEERATVQQELRDLEQRRAEFTEEIDDRELHTYDAIRGRTGRKAVADLTEDGACGNCFGIVPLQVQNEIRHGEALIRCEACGVILSAPDPTAEASDSDATAADDLDEALVEE